MGNKPSTSTGEMRGVLRGGASPIQFYDAGALPAEHYPKMPAAGTDEVLVTVRAAAINPVDYKVNKWILGAVMGLDDRLLLRRTFVGTRWRWAHLLLLLCGAPLA